MKYIILHIMLLTGGVLSAQPNLTSFYAVYNSDKFVFTWANDDANADHSVNGFQFAYKIEGQNAFSVWKDITTISTPINIFGHVFEFNDNTSLPVYLKIRSLGSSNQEYESPLPPMRAQRVKIWPVRLPDGNPALNFLGTEAKGTLNGFNQIINGPSWYPHEGWDLNGDPTTNDEVVVCPVSGILFTLQNPKITADWPYSDGEGSAAIAFYENGKGYFIELNHLDNVDPALLYQFVFGGIPISVYPGQILGKIDKIRFASFGNLNIHSHVHFGFYNVDPRNPDWSFTGAKEKRNFGTNFLDPHLFFDSAPDRDPFEERPKLFDSNQDGETLTFVNETKTLMYNKNNVFGGIDIIAEVGDSPEKNLIPIPPFKVSYFIQRLGLGNWNNTIGTNGPLTLLNNFNKFYGKNDCNAKTYNIGPYETNKCTDYVSALVNTSYVDTRSLAFANPTNADANCFAYIITNALDNGVNKFRPQSGIYWNSQCHKDWTAQQDIIFELGLSGPGSYETDPYKPALKANVNEEAKFPDDRYRVIILSADAVGENNDTVEFVINNYAPYLKKIMVENNGPSYKAERIWDKTEKSFMFKTTPSLDQNGNQKKFLTCNPLVLNLSFSEHMKEAAIVLPQKYGLGLKSFNASPVGKDSINWSVTVSVADLKTIEIENNALEIIVEGSDLSNLSIVGFKDHTDITTIAEMPSRKTDGTWDYKNLAQFDASNKLDFEGSSDGEALTLQIAGYTSFLPYCGIGKVIAKVKATGGKEPYNFNWYTCDNPEPNTACFEASNPVHLVATVKDADGCIAKKSVYIGGTFILCLNANDPNEISGPPGTDSIQWVAKKDTLSYTIRYENNPETATAPAQRVYLELPIDEKADASTFRVGKFGFAGMEFDVPASLPLYQARVDARDSTGMFVDVIAGVDIDAHKAFWIFQAVDPATGLPPADATMGLLPVNDSITHKGEGFVEFSIKAKTTAVTGDSIRGKAKILFDQNDTIPTNIWKNIIDAVAPTSMMLSTVDPEIDSTRIPLLWVAQDDPGGCGIGGYNVFVSEDGQAFEQAFGGWPDSFLLYEGERGHTYRFFIQAVDRVSNKESLKNAAEIEVRIKNNPRLDFLSVNSIGLCGGDSLRMVWNSEEIDAVNIAYSTNAGGTFTTLVGNLPDSLHYFAFRVPDDAQPQSLLLRISDAAVPAQGQDTLSVLVHPRPVVMASPAETAICVGSPLELTASGLTGSYYWSPSYALNRPDSNMVQVIATETTRFFVTARDGYGCTAVDSALVIIYPVDSVFLQAIACTEADTGILREVLQSQFGCDSIVVTERMLDTFPPVVITRDIEVVLGADGEVTITPQNVDDGTFDDCTVASLSLDRSTFSCTDLGAQTVWLTAIDQRGNRDSAITLITVVDTRPLSPVCQDLTVYLNGSGQAPVTVAEVSNSSSDNCIVAAKSIMPNQFACNELGPNLATLTITDNAGNTATCTATITVLDTIRPLLACPSNQSIPLYAGCSGVLPDYRNSAVASDNCTFYLTQLPLAGTALTGTGTLTITLIAADPSANDRSCTFTVTRVDLSAPAITCAAHVQVNNDPGQCQAAVTIPGPAVADNCSTLSANTLINNINLSNDASGTYPVGTATVLWTATDASGNTATCAQTVTVIDSQAPSLSCPGPQDVILSGNCDGALPDFRGLVMASDNCSPGASIILDQSPDVNTPLSGYGDLTVVITGHDQAGNPATCFFLVQKTDTHAPTIQCPDPVVLAIGSNCQVATPDFSQNAVFSDNCGTPLVTQYPLAGTLLTGLGATSVTLTAQDVAGNTATCTFVVTRMDQTEPDISCPPDQVLSLNATCTVSLADYRSQANATDNCSITLQQTPVPGTLLNGPGEQPVSITVSDLSGNSSNCSFTIEKRDILPPVITTCPPNRDVLLDPACALTVPDLLPELVVADNCAAFGALDRSQSPAAGTSLPVADGQAQPVLITVSDASGNSSTCWVTLTAQDQTAPTVTCPAALPLLLLAGCQASTPDYTVQALVSDNCSDASTLTLTQLPLAGTFQNGTGSLTVTITASDAAGNTDVCVFAVNVVDETPPLIQCQDLTVPLDASGAAAVSIAELNTGSSDNCGVVNLSKVSGLTTYSCANAGSNYAVVLKATDISGNTATCTAQVTVQDNLPPTALCKNATVSLDASGNAVLPVAAVNNNSSDACGLQTLELSQHSFDCSAIGQHTVQLTVTDNNGNSSGCTTIVAVTDTLAPVPEVDPLPVITVKCSVTVIAPTATDICSGSISATTTDPLTYGNQGTHIITWLYTDTQGNTSTQTQTVVVNNNTPVALLCPAAQSLILDAPTCSVVLPYYGGLSVASDNCGSVSIIQSPAASTVYSGVQTLSITLTAIGSGGNSADCIFPVNIIDQTDPVAHCKHATVYLDPSGLASVSSPQIDNLSTDACTIASTSVSPHEFTCTETGSNTVTLTVTDINGNSATCTATVTVLDTLPPVASCQPATVYLDASGHVTVAAAAINFNSSDACGFQSFNLSQTDYDCTTTATPNALVLTVTDHSGNTATCSTTVTVVDNTAPLALCQDIMVQLGSSGTVSLTTAQIDDGSTDACGLAELSVSPSMLSCGLLGDNTVTLTVADQHGNTSTCTAMVTVQDPSAPSISCPQGQQTLPLGPDCSVALPDFTVLATAQDNCSFVLTQEPAAGTVQVATGSMLINLTATDVSGKTAICGLLVEVVDNLPPITQCHNATVQLQPNGQVLVSPAQVDNGSMDNCGIQSLVLSKTAFYCSNTGPNPVTLTVTDIHANSSTCLAVITVEDHVEPIALCRNILLPLDLSGQASITAAEVDNGSTDACGLVGMVLSKYAFNCSDVGTNDVVLTATDPSGNSSTCNSIISVQDLSKPIVHCKNISLPLNASGQAILTVANINDGSTDACGIASVNASPNSFTCFNVGDNSVTLTVTDNNGNAQTCTATVTIQDQVAPLAVCKDVIVQLNAAGTANITAGQVDNGSTDACGIQALSLSAITFGCANVNANTVTLTATDNHGNTSTCQATVTVQDHVSPAAQCQQVTVQLNAAGVGSTTAAAVNNGSFDACGISSMTLSQTAFQCANVGPNPVTLLVTDPSGNTATCQTVVNVQDHIAPLALCKPATVQLNTAGTVTIAPGLINNGSSDNCGIQLLTLSKSIFYCIDLGANPVTMTITDVNGNVQSCQATVTVQDPLIPFITCPANLLVSNDPGLCSAVVSYSVTASDNCAYSLLQTAGLPPGSAFPIGTTLQIFKATDAAGNPHSCSFTVTVTAQQTADPALLNAYTVIGTGDISMKANQVQSGGVGIVDNNSKLKLGQGSVVTNANTFVKATQLQLIGGSQVTTYYQGQVPASLFPTFLYNTSPGTNNLTIPDNSAPVNLPLGSYGAINIGKNVVATFTGNATVKVKTLTMGDGASLRFVQDTKVLIAEGMDGGSNIRINTGSGYTSKIVQIFVAQGVTLDAGTQITATMDMLGDFKIKKATAANPNLMTGLFLAAKVTADDYTYWNWSAPTCQVNLAMTVPHKDSLGARINPAAKMMAEDILLFPNPANQEVNVSILRRIEQPFQILVYDAFGRLMEHRKLDSYVDEPLRLEVSSWPAGRYRIAVVIGSSQTVSRTFVVAR